MAMLVAALVIVTPLLAIFAGHTADAAALRQQHAERGWYPVSAVLHQNAAQAVITVGDMEVAWVRAAWTDHGGRHHAGIVPAALNARTGQRVQIWITAAGQETSPRIGTAQVRDRVMFAVGLAVAGWIALIGLSAVSVRVLADRRRMAGWQRDWDAAGPRWSHHG